MAIEFLSHIGEELAVELSLIHMAAFPEKQGWKGRDIHELLEISFHHLVVDYDASNQVNGFLLYSLILDEAEILTFCVDPVKQHQGIGTTLLNVFFTKMREKQVKIVLLDVAENNLAAVNLYYRLGFSLNGRRSNYYENKIDALLMSLSL
ncbi:ribosomal protein S18-alanine N-acetyltransferase [Commensalibacter communis]|uniref:ribosomal protein S18-alanine N-acetyltransferase n=1 Tax=Commensalibacter communis TaxID=2972786 RepID=UPI0022FFBA32|nr:ribosomal protein S18-alanine N-acetyltransferase [Commensalibacter communis]CAI3952712.1 Ribosomal protein S18 acetylase RimI and related acetyltransferases (RimI) (PDB:1GHE) [Commensalibacter communis]CAI3953713.1 Ribosomal protein S18 acetylase RimI and related acetyltransferases (RimI) (PDB:1GHE) [Commensalibacter communis]